MSDKEIVCTRCGGVNRVPDSRPAVEARCGVCHERLFSGHPAEADSVMFDKQVARSTIPVAVDVWAPWCGPCRMMAPAYEAAARELEPKVRFLKLNSDAEQTVAGRLGIRGIPTLLLYARGREIARQSGAMTAPQIVRWLKERTSGQP